MVALFSGVLSACMAFALAAGKPIAETAVQYGAQPLWQNNAVLVVILWGGFTTNLVWCLILNYRNKTGDDYGKGTPATLARNYFFSSLAGMIWYLQFFFYGMGSTQMGSFDFVSWTLHMSFIIVLSNIWGLYLKEWENTSRATKKTIMSGLVIIITSILFIGYGVNLG